MTPTGPGTDGVLIDLGNVARHAGIRFPTALTSAAWGRYVRLPEGVTGQEEVGRLWDILWMLRYAILAGPRGNPILFELLVQNNKHALELVTLKSHAGPGDDGEPVITIMLSGQD